MITIEYLNWDSNFFSKNIGKTILDYGSEIDPFQLKKYDLIYVFSDSDQLPYPIVDKKVIFTIDNLQKIKNFVDLNIEFFNPEIDSYDDILSLAIQSGEYSRFKKDANFKNNEYEKLYTEWIDKSLSKELAFEIIVKRVDSKVVGFATISKKSDTLADIGLVAVDQNYRGMGIGKEIMNKTVFFAREKGFESIQVVTQLDNIPATKLYENAGFKISSINYIYHIWNHDTI